MRTPTPLADNAPMAALPAALSPRRSILARALIMQFACALIALVLWSFQTHVGLWVMYVYSFFIGNLCWLIIDGARELIGVWRWHRVGGIRQWPGLAWMAPVVVVGTAIGYALGSAIGDALFRHQPWSLRQSAPALLVSVIAAGIIVWVFYTRERLHGEKLAAAAAERQAAEAQLKLLQSQLEPHMLFNTLANLRALIGVDPSRA
jgi:amino acid transporter